MTTHFILSITLLLAFKGMFAEFYFSPSQEQIPSIIDNEFVSRVLNEDISIIRLDSLFDSSEVRFTLKDNRHNTAAQDTIFTFKSELDFLKIYRAGEKVLPL